MKFYKTLSTLLAAMLLLVHFTVNGQIVERTTHKYKFGTEEMKIGFISDDEGNHYLGFHPNQDGSNMSYIDQNGAFVISEPRPCRIDDIESMHPSKLYVRQGAVYSEEPMWSTTFQPENLINARMAGPLDDESSILKLRSLKLYPEGEGRVGIDPDEIKNVIPTAIGSIRYDGTIYTTFNGSQVFYHQIGAIRFIDTQTQILKEENETLKSKIESLEAGLENLSAAVEELKHGVNPRDESSKIVNIYPNPTNNVVRIEFEIQEIINYAEVRIMDLLGRTVHKQNVNISDRTININLNDSQMAHGQYICTLIIDNKAVDTGLISFIE